VEGLYWRREPQDVASKQCFAAMLAIWAEDVHQFPDLKARPPLEDIQAGWIDPKVQVKIEVGQMPIFGQPNPDVFIQIGFHITSPY
jgi:hypothetical protein